MDDYDRDPDPPGPYAEPRPRSFQSGLAVGCLVPIVLVCLAGAGLLYAVGDLLGFEDDPFVDVLPLVLGWVAVFVVVLAAHGFTIWWTWRHRPGLRAAVLLHAPFPPAYVAALAWWHLGDWPAWWIVWGLAVLVALTCVLL